MLEHFGKWAETTVALELNGKPIEASYRVELNETQTTVENETLTIGGKPVDMAAGRVFLIDLTIEPQIYRQLNSELPAVPSDLKSEADAERAAETIRKHLESREPEIERWFIDK